MKKLIFRFPLTALFAISVLPLIGLVPGMGGAEVIDLLLGFVMMYAYLLIAFSDGIAGLEWPWTIFLIVPWLFLIDLFLVPFVRSFKSVRA